MSNIETGGPAFPEPGLSGLPNGEFIYGSSGMTMRDYIAAKAMQAFLQDAVLPRGFYAKEGLEYASMLSYEAADAMLKARKS